jgi:putative efflux protein, MATE family
MNLENMKNNTVRMILQFSIPSIIAMVLSSFITIVDGFFIGNYIGKEGIAAVNLGLPILYVYLGIGIMFGVGGISIAGRELGAQNKKKCNDVFNQTYITVTLVTVIMSVVAELFLQSGIRAIGLDESVASCFVKYYSIMILAYPIMILNNAFGMFIRGEGKPHLFMIINIITVLCNIILDYLFIRWFGWGIQGIATASLISVILGLICMIGFFLRKSDVYQFHTFQFSKTVLRDTLFNGSAEFIGQMSMGISMFAYNWVIMRIVGVSGVAAFTIVGYVAYIFNMIIVGFGQGASPLVSFSYGAKEIVLSTSIRKKTNQFVFLSGVIVIIILFAVSGWYSNIFVKNESVAAFVHSGIKIFVLSFLFSGINTITTFYFSSIGKAKESAIISASRGLVILLLCIVTLPALLGMTGVWLVAPVTEVFTIVISFILIWKYEKSIVAKEA